MARRLAERGVRFIEVFDSGSAVNWDHHNQMSRHAKRAAAVDQPLAAMLGDLKARGLLADTLVVWATEFGRTPWAKTVDHAGRDHHPHAFSCWLAGAGIRPGIVHGTTDDHGMHVTANPVDIHDLHATILHLLGLDHETLTYRHAGRDFRLTDVAGHVVTGLLA